MSQIGAALFYYKLGQKLFQIRAASLMQVGTSVVINWCSYYELGQPLLQNREAITNWVKMYYKLRQLLQIRAIIRNWGITGFFKVEVWFIWSLYYLFPLNLDGRYCQNSWLFFLLFSSNDLITFL